MRSTELNLKASVPAVIALRMCTSLGLLRLATATTTTTISSHESDPSGGWTFISGAPARGDEGKSDVRYRVSGPAALGPGAAASSPSQGRRLFSAADRDDDESTAPTRAPTVRRCS